MLGGDPRDRQPTNIYIETRVVVIPEGVTHAAQAKTGRQAWEVWLHDDEKVTDLVGELQQVAVESVRQHVIANREVQDEQEEEAEEGDGSGDDGDGEPVPGDGRSVFASE